MSIKIKEVSPEEYLKLSQNDAKRALDQAMGKFDFSRAADALKGCKWKYVGAKESPTADDLRKIGKELLMQCIQSGAGASMQRGPLSVSSRCYDTPEVVTVDLTLTPLWASVVYIDCRAILAKHMKKRSKAK